MDVFSSGVAHGGGGASVRIPRHVNKGEGRDGIATPPGYCACFHLLHVLLLVPVHHRWSSAQ